MPQNYCDSKKIINSKMFNSTNLLILFSLITFAFVGSSVANAQVTSLDALLELVREGKINETEENRNSTPGQNS